MDEFNRHFRPADVVGGNQPLLPLALAGQSERVLVVEFRSGDRMDERLKDMGLAPGVEVRVVQNDGTGPLLLQVGATRLALGAGMARKIMVTLIEETQQ